MLLNFENLGEKTLNKIAEIALSKRIEKADRLTVQVKTNANLLAQGTLESLAIEGRGLVMNRDLCMQEMTIDLQTIAVNPLKALRGNIQLTRPSRGTVLIRLSEGDIERAYRSMALSDRQLIGVRCRLATTGEMEVRLQTRSRAGESPETLSLTILPALTPFGDGVSIEITAREGGDPHLVAMVERKTREIFTLKNFEIDGISLKIERIEVIEGKLTLAGQAGITHFPTS